MTEALGWFIRRPLGMATACWRAEHQLAHAAGGPGPLVPPPRLLADDIALQLTTEGTPPPCHHRGPRPGRSCASSAWSPCAMPTAPPADGGLLRIPLIAGRVCV